MIFFDPRSFARLLLTKKRVKFSRVGSGFPRFFYSVSISKLVVALSLIHSLFDLDSVDVAIQNMKPNQRMCRACNQPITDRYVLQAIDSYWHEGCLKCACCECRLGDIGSSLYCKSNLILCKRDYLR